MSNVAAASPGAKRKRIRKGTTSCWECKRRKVKCEYEEDKDGPPCKPCTQRGLKCVSQELPEPRPYLSYGNGAPATGGSRQINEQTPLDLESATSHHASHVHNALSLKASDGLSRSLLDAMPSRDDLVKILDASNNPSLLAHEINTIPYNSLRQQRATTRDTLLAIPTSDTHPVLIAKHILLVASFIQQLHPNFIISIAGLSVSPLAIMHRLVGVAGSLVTTNDELLGTIESIECLMIEGLFQMNTGNLRRAWITVRRALNIAQLMKLGRRSAQIRHKVLSSQTRYDPQHMWLKIVFLDRYLCLMLGLPQGCTDRSMVSDAILANDTPMGRLERIHCVVASEILERNEIGPGSEDMAITQALDKQLQKAAKDLPSKWWLTPNREATVSDPETSFWNVRQLFAQILHYDLLNQLHLPYMLCSRSSMNSREYSRITCANASREMLARWIALRNSKTVACSCRSVDFVALMAAMTLVLAHLDGRRSETNTLAHQYQSDRAMIEQVQECMEELDRSNSDALSAKSADLLHGLLAIDDEGADGETDDPRVEVEGMNTTSGDYIGASGVNVHIPYFGTIKIARAQYPSATHASEESVSVSSRLDAPNQSQPAMLQTPDSYASQETGAHESHIGLLEPFLGPDVLPSLAAGLDDWTFQGVDQAFFESLMSNGNGHGDTIDWGFPQT
ncbi:hypothetical protein M409DRAFT_67481 [Zasmidium cellare ATCC 36951]|uniref:Zn(2)-C6 fungal-type domain-containing protein n=1 Tax=Zasmidium cellare ATCC 36951 TaxID=1080233 RepID=A0A6A6CG88_ZASCE|nr:uncharacterized protein M409DRAFT_67481 [Zasmidium cellare ATCC 36951]KAF2165230.1 hypothetical protein M409DRAFT_67481 [Zasmidium cellare ATCC 36951]